MKKIIKNKEQDVLHIDKIKKDSPVGILHSRGMEFWVFRVQEGEYVIIAPEEAALSKIDIYRDNQSIEQVTLDSITNDSIIGVKLSTKKVWVAEVEPRSYGVMSIGERKPYNACTYKIVRPLVYFYIREGRDCYLFDSEDELREWLLK